MRKWLEDIATTAKNYGPGSLPVIAPGLRPRYGNAFPSAGGAINGYVWGLFLHTGDTSVLEKYLPLMLQASDNIDSRLNADGLFTEERSTADWGDVEPRMIGEKGRRYERNSIDGRNFPVNTPHDLTETSAVVELNEQLSMAAAVLGRLQIIDIAKRRADMSRIALQEKFYDNVKGSFGSQAANGEAIQFCFAPAGMKNRIICAMTDDIVRHQNHFTAGTRSLRYVLRTLSEYQPDLAYTVMTEPGYPGYRHMHDLGSSTVWAMWDGNTRTPHLRCSGRAIQNCYAAIGLEWLYYSLAGFKPDPAAPGFKNTIIAPGIPHDLEQFNAWIETPYGCLKSNWKWTGEDELDWEVFIPANSTAELVIPAIFGSKVTVTFNGKTVLAPEGSIRISSGHYYFKLSK
jgi:alpha-L-rhamnosidase